MAERARAGDGRDAAGLQRKVREERRLLDVGGFAIPLIHVAGAGRDFVPFGILRGEILVKLAEHFRLQRGLHEVADFLQARPDVLQENRLAVLAGAERVVDEVNIHAARERERDDERRRHEEVRLDVLVDARLEIAVAGKHGCGDQIIFHHGILDGRVQRAGIANAGGATVADEIETKLVEERLQAGLVQIIADDARAGRERRFDSGIDRKPLFNGFLREQAGGEHDAGIAGVGATGDGCDEHGTVAHVTIQLRSSCVNRIGCGMFRSHLPFASLSATVLTAASGMNLAARRDMHGARQLFGLHAESIFGDRLAERCEEFAFEFRQFDAVLRPFRAGDAGQHGAEVEFQFLRIGDVAFLRNAPQALRLVIIFVGLARLPRCGRWRGGNSRIRRQSGRSPSSRRIRAPCWRWSRGPPAAAPPRRGRRIPRTCRRLSPCGAVA